MKVAIVNPSFNMPFYKNKASIIHGIALIIAYCEQNGQDVDLIDLRKISSWGRFEEIVKDYDVVGYSIMSFDVDNIFKALSVNKTVNKDVITIVGGMDPTTEYDKYVNSDLVDYVIRGEGEISFCNLINQIEANEGVIKNGYIEKVIDGEKIDDLDSINFINRDLWDNELEVNYEWSKEPFSSILISRFCKYNCKFCQPGPKEVFGFKERFRSPENVVTELLEIKNTKGLNSFIILDDNAFQNREWLEGFIKNYAESGITAKFMMSGRSDNIYKNRDLVPKLKELGLSMVSVGFESASNRILKMIRKGNTAEMNEKAANVLNENNISIQANLLFGVLGETKDEINESINFIKRIKPEVCGCGALCLYPSTHFFREYKEKGLIFPNSPYSDPSPGIPKIKGINYFYINYAMLKLRLFMAKTMYGKVTNILYHGFMGIKLVKYYLTYYISAVFDKKHKSGDNS
ncbi:MAG: B12-binding domain-containing radical SAM protein [Methanobacteriaceae archaeon]